MGGHGGRRSGPSATSGEVARHVWVSGRVQGVFFRASTRDEARRRDVAGWVRNTADGRVEAHLQGPRARVDELVDWMRVGPSAAHVSDLEVAETDPVDLHDFDVRG